MLLDTAMDLETNATLGLARENSLLLQHGPLPDDAVVKTAQTFRSGPTTSTPLTTWKCSSLTKGR